MPCRVHSAQIIQRAGVSDESADFTGLCAVEGREAGQPLHDSIDGLGHQIYDSLVVSSLVLYLGGAIWSDDGSVGATFIIGSGFTVPGYHLVSQNSSQQCLDFEIWVCEAPEKKGSKGQNCLAIKISSLFNQTLRRKSWTR